MCTIFINGTPCATHTGGNVGFCVDITDYLKPDSEQSLAVAVYDPAKKTKRFREVNNSGKKKALASGILEHLVSGKVFGWNQ